MRDIDRQLRRRVAFLGLIWLAAASMLTGCRTADANKFPPSVAAPGQPTHTIYVTANHWHAGLVLADDDLPPRLDRAIQPWREELTRRGLPPAAWHEFGWGDDAYYKAPSGTKTSGMAAAALLWPTRSTNHVRALDLPPEAFFAGSPIGVFRVELSPVGYQALADFLLTRLTEPVALEPSDIDDPSGAFLTANPKRKYHALHNCNHMVADALAAAGLPISPIYAVHSVNVEYQLDHIAAKYDEVTRIQSREDFLDTGSD
ncbi:MAG: DUF2459 domain-containing protein [Planctomycetota bacterium]